MRKSNRLIHVVHVQESLEVGGLENGVVNISNGLDPERFQTTICCLNRLGPLTNKISNLRVRTLCLYEREGKRPGLFLKLRRLFSTLSADIIHTHNFYSGLYGIVAGRLGGGFKVIHGEHGNHSFSSVTGDAVVRFVYPLADRILTVSEAVEYALIQEGIPPAKIKCIRNGVDTDRFNPSAPYPGNGHSQGFGDNHTVFGYVGRLSPEKGVDRLIDAFARVHRDHPASRLTIVGDGPVLEQLRHLADSLAIQEAVQFVGARLDVDEFYRRFDIFVLPSLVEGMSNVVLEAMASGLAIIATDVGGNGELITSGQNGLIVKADCVEALANTMRMLATEKEYRRRLAEAALYRARADFSVKRMIEDYSNLYIDLMS